jgi:4-amino-4-deoxy-L-arabinose transferase-like glycosyltransferase
MRTRDLLLVALILLGACAVRFFGLDWALPYHFNSDERVMMIAAEQLRAARSIAELPVHDPKFFIYPPLLMHLLILLAAPVFHFVPFSPADPSSSTLYYLLGRGISASFGAATVLLVYLLGKQAYSRGAGLLGAAFLAFSVLHVRDSHFFTTDVPLTFFFVLMMLLALRIAAGGGNRAWVAAGLAAGLAFATKQTSLMFLPVLLLAHVMAAFPDQTRPGFPALREKALSAAFWRPLLVFGAVAGLTALAMNPYALIAPREYLAQVETVSKFLGGSDQRNWVFQFTGTTFSYWFTNLLWFGMGPPLLAAGLLGALWALPRRTRADVLILFFLALYLGTVGRGFMKFIRYALPLIPFLALLGARFFVELRGRLRGAARAAATLAAAAVLLFSLFLTGAYLNIYRAGDARVLASRWVHETIPAGTTVVADNSNTTPLLGNPFTRPAFFDNYILCLNRDECVVQDHYTIKVLNMKSYNSKSLNPPERFEGYIRERLQGAEYVIVGDEFYEQYRHREADYPAVVRFYRELFAGERGFREVRTFQTRPSLFGLTWDDDGAELSFRLFDHPKVRIFRRVEGSTPTGGTPS